MMEFFKFSPEFIDRTHLEEISVGRNDLVQGCIKRIKASVDNKSARQMLFLGPHGIGKTHTVSRIFHDLSKSDKVTTIRFADNEYAITSIDDFCRRILEELGAPHDGKNSIIQCKHKLDELKNNGRPAILFAGNVQAMFMQMRPDLGNLRSLIQSDQSLSIVGTSVDYFDEITSPDAPFYRGFEITQLQDLTESQSLELIRKRLVSLRKEAPAGSWERRVKALRLITGGNPRILHILAETMVQESLDAPDGLTKTLLMVLDQMTPFYQSKMGTMSPNSAGYFTA